nr:MAG TPA: hypothetical protein [Caudoviricetes sp.]
MSFYNNRPVVIYAAMKNMQSPFIMCNFEQKIVSG